MGRIEGDGRHLLVHVRAAQDLQAEVSRAISGAGGVIVGVAPERGGLEDAFLRLVQEGAW